ncbi:MAG: hypothetical protein ACXWNW_09115 [Isosphaeraceae bacterium]
MTLVELATLTRDTRRAQSRYFGTKTYPEKNEALKEAKGLERRLDLSLAAILDDFGPDDPNFNKHI